MEAQERLKWSSRSINGISVYSHTSREADNMGYRAKKVSNVSCDSFGLDRSLMSALGHARDDRQRFLQGCMRLANRSYAKVTSWFERDFYFLSINDRRDALHDFYVMLAHKLKTEKPQDNIQQFGEDEQFGKLRFRKYLYAIARNTARDFAEKQIRIHSHERRLVEDDIAAQAEELISEIMDEDTYQMMMEIKKRAKISDYEWAIFVASLRLSPREVASKLEIKSVGAVSAAIYRVNNKLVSVRTYIVSVYGHVGSLILSDAEKICNL